MRGTKSSSSLARRWGSRGLPRWRTGRGFNPIRQNMINKLYDCLLKQVRTSLERVEQLTQFCQPQWGAEKVVGVVEMVELAGLVGLLQ